MKKEDLINKNQYFQPKVISIGIEHLNQCLNLDRLALNGLWTKEQWHKEISTKTRKCFGIILNTEIIALTSGSLVLDELQISVLAVHPNKRRIGLGKKVLSFLLKEAKYAGAEKAFLEVRSTNKAAQLLYLNIGFEVIGLRRNFYRDGSNAIIFRCDLKNKIP